MFNKFNNNKRAEMIKDAIKNREKEDFKVVASTYKEATKVDENLKQLIMKARDMLYSNVNDSCPVKDLSQCPVLEKYPQISCNKCNKEVRDQVCNEIINSIPQSSNINESTDEELSKLTAEVKGEELSNDFNYNGATKKQSIRNEYITVYDLTSNPYLIVSESGILDQCPTAEASEVRANEIMLDQPSIRNIWIYKPVSVVERTTIAKKIDLFDNKESDINPIIRSAMGDVFDEPAPIVGGLKFSK
jgi:hypothetical protein